MPIVLTPEERVRFAAFEPKDNLYPKQVEQLYEANFDKSLTNSPPHVQWLIEFYSPTCSHCRLFRPHFKKVITDLLPKIEDGSIRVGIVDCPRQISLCDKTNIRMYPSLRLYRDRGSAFDEFKGLFEYNSFSAFVSKHIAENLEKQKPKPSDKQPPSQANAAENKRDFTDTLKSFNARHPKHADGLVHKISLDSRPKFSLHSNETYLVVIMRASQMRYAHQNFIESVVPRICAALMNSIACVVADYDEDHEFVKLVARNMYDGASVAVYVHGGGYAREYQGPLDASAHIVDFALSCARAQIANLDSAKATKSTSSITARTTTTSSSSSSSINEKDTDDVNARIARLAASHEVAVIYVSKVSAYADTFEHSGLRDALSALVYPPWTRFLATTDSAVVSKHGPHALIVLRRGHEATKIPRLSLPASPSEISQFILRHRFPMVPELDEFSASDIFAAVANADADAGADAGAGHRTRIALATLNPYSEVDELSALQAFAKSAFEARPREAPYAAWVNVVKYSEYALRVLGVEADDGPPRVIVIEPSASTMYRVWRSRSASAASRAIAFDPKDISDAMAPAAKPQARSSAFELAPEPIPGGSVAHFRYPAGNPAAATTGGYLASGGNERSEGVDSQVPIAASGTTLIAVVAAIICLAFIALRCIGRAARSRAYDALADSSHQQHQSKRRRKSGPFVTDAARRLFSHDVDKVE